MLAAPQARVAGATVRAVAQRHGVRSNLLSYWRCRPAALGEAKDFAAVQIATPAPAAAVGGGVIEIELTSGCVRIRGIVDGAMLREALAAVR